MPREGIPLSKRFTPEQLTQIYDNLRRMGAPLGITFGEVKVTPNSRLALEASEFARDQGRFHSFHDRVFRAYFTEGRDIGKLDVILELAGDLGLGVEELKEALNAGSYLRRLADARREGEELGISAVPTFLIDGSHKVVGAQPLDSFRRLLKREVAAPHLRSGT